MLLWVKLPLPIKSQISLFHVDCKQMVLILHCSIWLQWFRGNNLRNVCKIFLTFVVTMACNHILLLAQALKKDGNIAAGGLERNVVSHTGSTTWTWFYCKFDWYAPGGNNSWWNKIFVYTHGPQRWNHESSDGLFIHLLFLLLLLLFLHSNYIWNSPNHSTLDCGFCIDTANDTRKHTNTVRTGLVSWSNRFNDVSL